MRATAFANTRETIVTRARPGIDENSTVPVSFKQYCFKALTLNNAVFVYYSLINCLTATFQFNSKNLYDNV